MNPQRILILKPSSLGDIVHTLPAAAALRARFPSAHITWMVNPEWEPLLAGHPGIDKTLVFPRADFRGPGGWLRFWRWRTELAGKMPRPDLILDFQGLLRTAIVARAFPGTPLHGMSDAREGSRFFQTHTVAVDQQAHAVERYLALAAAAGAQIAGPLSFDLPPGEPPSHALPDRPFVVLHPFSRGHGKSLPMETVSAFCREIGHPVVLAGRTDATVGPPPDNVADLLNATSLSGLIWVLRRAAFVVSVDSGPMHLAAAVTDRLLGVHTWSDPCQVGPYRPGAHVWKARNFFPALDPLSSLAPSVVPGADDAAVIARWVRERIA